MHGHHPHLIAPVLHVSLHLAVRFPQVGEEARQRGRLGIVVAEREVEKLIDRIGSFGAEPRQKLGAPALAIEKGSEELERRHEVGARAPALQRLDGGAKSIVVVAVRDERLPQRPSASRRDRHEIIVVKADQRALQHFRQRQVVLRQRQEIAQRHEIGDRDLLGKA